MQPSERPRETLPAKNRRTDRNDAYGRMQRSGWQLGVGNRIASLRHRPQCAQWHHLGDEKRSVSECRGRAADYGRCARTAIGIERCLEMERRRFFLARSRQFAERVARLIDTQSAMRVV